jgi:hypothetical protein
MREHQIIITLKPEQFQEMQRLFKEAGAKSMGIFARQKLLDALGMGKKVKEAAVPPPQFQQALGELQRLQGELRALVTDTLEQPYHHEDSQVNEVAASAETVELADPETMTYEEIMAEFADAHEELSKLAQKGLEISPGGELESPGELKARRRKHEVEPSDPLQELLQESEPGDSNASISEELFSVRLPPEPVAPPASSPPAIAEPPPPPIHSSGPGHSAISGGPPPRKRRS